MKNKHISVKLYQVVESLDGWEPMDILLAFRGNLIYFADRGEYRDDPLILNWVKDHGWILEESENQGVLLFSLASLIPLVPILKSRGKGYDASELSSLMTRTDLSTDFIVEWKTK